MPVRLSREIDTRLVYGFLDAGKTTYIEECVVSDTFHQYGRTLILAYEQGEREYDADRLEAFRCRAAYCEPGEEPGAFARRQLERFEPDRVYVEMNAMLPDLAASLPESLRVRFATTRVAFATLDLYLNNLRAQMMEMVSRSDLVTFCGCPSREALAPYGPAFRLMNRRAVYLRQDPMGYHERAFERFVPFSLEGERLRLGEEDFLPFYLDALEHPEHYAGKELCFDLPLELRTDCAAAPLAAGRQVMTCCLADLQFMALPLSPGEGAAGPGWVRLRARAGLDAGRLALKTLRTEAVRPPAQLILTP